jgi:hypothetical protein
MAKRMFTNKLVSKYDISEELCKIEESANAFITPSGAVYFDYGDDMMYPARTFINNHNGYVYVGLKSANGKMIQRRVHRLVAKAYLPNSNNLPVVCHKDNNKANPELSNLKWGTTSSNTKEAYDDGLARNDKGWNDSQSMPVCCFDRKTKEWLCNYGSVSEASRITGVTKTGILYQCNNRPTKRFRSGFIFRYMSDFLNNIFVL